MDDGFAIFNPKQEGLFFVTACMNSVVPTVVDYIIKLGFPVFARYKTPRDINGRWRLVDHNVPITIGNVHIKPGDYVVGDHDGAVIIPQEIAAEVVAKAEEVVHTENLVRKEILQGTHPLEAFDKYGRF